MQQTATATKQRKRRRIILRGDTGHRACEQAGLVTDTQRAEAFSTSRTAVNLIQNGHRSPSNEFIAEVMDYFGPRFVRFDDLFEVAAG